MRIPFLGLVVIIRNCRRRRKELFPEVATASITSAGTTFTATTGETAIAAVSAEVISAASREMCGNGGDADEESGGGSRGEREGLGEGVEEETGLLGFRVLRRGVTFDGGRA